MLMLSGELSSARSDSEQLKGFVVTSPSGSEQVAPKGYTYSDSKYFIVSPALSATLRVDACTAGATVLHTCQPL